MINLAWGGLTNGAVPTSLLVDVSGRGDFMEPTAAAQFKRMQAAILRDVGFNLQPAAGSSAYRPLATQQQFYALYQAYLRGGAYFAVAAVPGTSNHGWARAVDLNISQYDRAAWAWMQAHAAEYGFSWATGKASGEDWHWESLTPPGAAVAGGDATQLISQPVPPQEENTMRIVKSSDKGQTWFLGELTYQGPFDLSTDQPSMAAHIWQPGTPSGPNSYKADAEPLLVPDLWIQTEIGQIQKRREQLVNALKALGL